MANKKALKIQASGNSRISEEDINSQELEAEIDETLIPEEALHYVLDTARRVKVDGFIHEISEAGTFVYDESHLVEFDSLYSNFIWRNCRLVRKPRHKNCLERRL